MVVQIISYIHVTVLLIIVFEFVLIKKCRWSTVWEPPISCVTLWFSTLCEIRKRFIERRIRFHRIIAKTWWRVISFGVRMYALRTRPNLNIVFVARWTRHDHVERHREDSSSFPGVHYNIMSFKPPRALRRKTIRTKSSHTHDVAFGGQGKTSTG